MAKVRMSQVYKGFSGSEVLRAGEIGVDQEAGIIKIGDGSSAWSQLDDKHTYYSKKQVKDLMVNNLGYLLVTNEADFIAAVTVLDQNKQIRKVVARDIKFVNDQGNFGEFIPFQGDLMEIEFDNCQWFCNWYFQGNDGDRKVSIKGLKISKANNEEARTSTNPKEYTIHLKYLDKIEDCSLDYQDTAPTNGSYGHSLIFEEFNVATNCKATSLMFGEQVSNCWVAQELRICKNCCNLIPFPLRDGKGKLIKTTITECEKIINFYGVYDLLNSKEPLEDWSRRVMPETIQESAYNAKISDGSIEERAYIIIPDQAQDQ